MARPLRIEYSDAVYHIATRENAKTLAEAQNCFTTKDTKEAKDEELNHIFIFASRFGSS